MPEAVLRQTLLRLGANVRRLREKHGWTQADLAEAIGVETRYVQAIEAGRASPSLRRIVSMAEGFEVDIRDLFRPEPHTKRNPGRPPKRRG